MAKHSHETTDVAIRPILMSGLVLLVVVVISFVSMAWLFKYYAAREKVSSESVHAVILPPEPTLQTTPRQDRQRIIGAHEAVLRSYGWVDKADGIAHIPIEQAMDLMLEKGYPAREE